RERAEREKAQQERQRLERMSSRELAQEIARLRPPRVIDLVERDTVVLQAEAERQALQNRHTEAGSASARARDQAQAWREAHKVQAWFHDKGIGHAPKLRELEQQREEHRAEWQRLGPRIEEASLRVQHVRQQAHQRITAEQAPTLAKVAELEAMQKEKARQEREAEAKRLAQKRIEAEREAVPKDFKLMAQKREMKASGWSDRGEQWKAAPEGLKKLIDGYNAAPKEMRPAILDRILNDGQRREQVRELLAEQRQQYRANDRGMSR
ncbi:hypothetical protein SAMN04488021_1765, partial [Paracoccus aminovorans]